MILSKQQLDRGEIPCPVCRDKNAIMTVEGFLSCGGCGYDWGYDLVHEIILEGFAIVEESEYYKGRGYEANT